ncbi:MAG TPA: protein-glutamate O-methyltransferase CheR [Bryobacteraceae bacterium]|nr:chemotaxis protein CheR [Bryobacterales bacterium]HRJ19205.1 protein-glutamate O-methyltransferase CheR [Bryobacteraceae bacterium]
MASSLTGLPPVPAIEEANYRFLQHLVYEGSGIVLEQDKHYLFETRLGSIARAQGAASVNDLCALLRGPGATALLKSVIEAMTTNETYFLREPAQYDAIRQVLLPALRAERAGQRRLSCWSAAASTGQEAYSLAMILAEEGLDDWNIQILGTDLNDAVLERARAARYHQIEVNRGLPTALLLRYFRRAGLDWEIGDRLRRMVRFQQFDLRAPMRCFGPFDLVFCRNILVYFDAPSRRRILEEIHGTLFRGGWLCLGGAESPSGLDALYERRAVGSAIVYVAQ